MIFDTPEHGQHQTSRQSGAPQKILLIWWTVHHLLQSVHGIYLHSYDVNSMLSVHSPHPYQAAKATVNTHCLYPIIVLRKYRKKSSWIVYDYKYMSAPCQNWREKGTWEFIHPSLLCFSIIDAWIGWIRGCGGVYWCWSRMCCWSLGSVIGSWLFLFFTVHFLILAGGKW